MEEKIEKLLKEKEKAAKLAIIPVTTIPILVVGTAVGTGFPNLRFCIIL